MTDLWKAAGAAAWGAVGFGGLLPYLSEEVRAQIEALCPHPGGVYVAAFPYFAGDAPGNLSLYCRGRDYHTVVKARLEEVCAGLRVRSPGYRFLPGADNTPVPELTAARLAGLGMVGRHNLMIVPPYGSYVFLGTILTDLPLETGAAEPSPFCEDCGACVKACPTGALSEAGFDREKCLSYLTQKKGELTEREREWLRLSPTAWGCDLCQRACPWNQTARETDLPEFRENLLAGLTAGELEGLTNRSFPAAFPDRAFTWRGPGPLRRNLDLQKNRE